MDGASDVNVGTDLSDPLVDVRIKDESGLDGTEYQERLSTTSGRIYFESDARSSTLKLEINENGLEDADSENIILNLENPVSGGLVQTDSTSMTFAIQDDDAAPNVSFQSTSFSGDEREDAKLNVELDQQAGTDLDVTFEGDGTGSATRGDDYTWSSDSTISISSGKTTGTFSVPVVDDSETEANETFDVSLTSTDTDAGLGSPSSATYTIVDNDGVGSTGPGGVGHTDGSGSLKLWLRGAEGVYSSDNCSGAVSDGTGVGCWQDQSGYGNSATQGEEDAKPAFQTGVQNGYPVVRFDSTSGTEKDVLEHSLTSVGNGSNTIFALAKTTDSGAQQGLFSVAPLLAGQDSIVTARTLGFASTDAVTAINGNETAGATAGAPGTNPAILSSTFTSDNTTVDVALDGSVVGTNTGSTESGEAARLGAEMRIDNQQNITNTNHFDGDISEVVAYETDLNAAQRNIVRNYLSAKYDVTLSNNDLYAGDADAGQYDHNVIGIGQDGTDNIADAHAKAEGGGLTLSEHSISDGDYVLLGNQAEIPSTDSLTYEGTGGLGGDLAVRPDNTQYLSITGSPAFNLTYDLSEIGLKGTAGDVSGYVLIHADPSTCTPSNNDCSWSDAGGSVTVGGDNVTFSDVSLAAGDYYLAIGTVDAVNSPLMNTYARTVEGDSGTDGADAGWRYLGVPVKGALIDDVQPPVSPYRNGFVTHSSEMDFHWSLDDGGSNTEGWTELHSGDPVPNGRGFIVYLWDDAYYPIDTELPLDVGPNDGTSGDVNVTVGDNTPGTDTPLNQDSTWHLLANPYATSFDLTGNLSGPDGNDLAGSGFSSTIQLWDPDQETYVTKMQGNDGDNLAEWQSFFVERSTSGQGDTELTFASAGRDAGSVDLVGSKVSSSESPRTIGLRLLVRESGEEVARDDAANIHFRDGADPGWDGHDASKLRPFTDKYATIAPMGGQTVRSRPRRRRAGLTPPRIPSASRFTLTFTTSTGQ